MKHRLTKNEVKAILRAQFYTINGLIIGAPDYCHGNEKDIINFQHFTHDFYKHRLVMFIPFKYDNYIICTWYQSTNC